MRVTLATFFSQTNRNLERLSSSLIKVTGQVTTGKRMSSISEDPISLGSALHLRNGRSEMLQYLKNMDFGSNFISATETSLNGLQDVVSMARGVANHHAGANYPQVDKDIAADYIHGLTTHALGIANSQFDGKFMFGGFKTAGYPATAPTPFGTDAEGNVFYTGDPDHNLAIRFSQRSTMEVSINGQAAMMDNNLFGYLKDLEDALKGINYTQAISPEQATNTTVPLNSGLTGLAGASLLSSGTFDVTVTDHSSYPPVATTYPITVNTATDTLDSIAAQITAATAPALTAAWGANGYLQIASTDPDLYTFDIANDTTSFTTVVGLTPKALQSQAISQAYVGLSRVYDDLAAQITDFGIRKGRLDMQEAIYERILVSTENSLQNIENVDLTKAALELKSLETAYEAALAAASKAMQMSLVNFL